MQALDDVRRKQVTTMAPRRNTGATYARVVAKACSCLCGTPLVAPEKGALRFIGTQVQRWDGEQWQPHRMPGMHRRGGKWVRR